MITQKRVEMDGKMGNTGKSLSRLFRGTNADKPCSAHEGVRDVEPHFLRQPSHDNCVVGGGNIYCTRESK